MFDKFSLHHDFNTIFAVYIVYIPSLPVSLCRG